MIGIRSWPAIELKWGVIELFSIEIQGKQFYFLVFVVEISLQFEKFVLQFLVFGGDILGNGFLSLEFLLQVEDNCLTIGIVLSIG